MLVHVLGDPVGVDRGVVDSLWRSRDTLARGARDARAGRRGAS